MTDDASACQQQTDIRAVCALVSKGLARPLRSMHLRRVNERMRSSFCLARAGNPLVYFRLLALSSDLAFGFALYWFFLRRPPDPNGLNGLFQSLYDQSASRPQLVRRYMLSAEACEKTPYCFLLKPMDVLLRLFVFVLTLPLVGWSVRLVWRLATLPAYLKEREASRYETELIVAELEAQKEDELEYKNNPLARPVAAPSFPV